VRYSWEQPNVLGSAGGPRLALPLLAADTFFIVNGDTLTDVDPAALYRAHRASGALITLALVPNTSPEQYGGVQLDAGGAVTRFWDVGTPADYLRTHEALGGIGDATVGRRGLIDRSAHVTRSILWDDVIVESGCQIDRCVVTDRVRVRAGSAYRDVMLVAGP